MKILAFAASTSSTSINKQLVQYATKQLETDDLGSHQTEVLDLNDYEMPIYNIDREQAGGIPALAQQLFDKIGQADAVIISFAEHNGSYAAAYKNTFDWMSRIDSKVYQNKKMVLLSTSPGGNGASSVLAEAVKSAPFFAAEVTGSLSVPNFHNVFDSASGELTDTAWASKLQAVLKTLA